ncbi:MAG: hypothetical protein WBR29_03030 [Gammaproteobacteria bacterium]
MHTPLPWTIKEDEIHSQLKHGSVCVAVMDGGAFQDADAALIIRAVNAHDELVRALERIATEILPGDAMAEIAEAALNVTRRNSALADEPSVTIVEHRRPERE